MRTYKYKIDWKTPGSSLLYKYMTMQIHDCKVQTAVARTTPPCYCSTSLHTFAPQTATQPNKNTASHCSRTMKAALPR